MARYNGINHLAMVTSDMDMTIRFWRDLLGMRLVAGLGKEGYRHYFFEISGTDMIAFFEWPGVKKIPERDHGVPVKGAIAFDHVSIGVESVEDLIEIKQKLAASEFWVSEIIDHGFIYSIYAFDPNNIPIEFSYNVQAVDIRRNPKMKDKHPCKTAMEGPDPQSGIWPLPTVNTEAEERQVYPGEGRIFVSVDNLNIKI
ncbi:MAG: VOC family protein [Desulfobacterales bacterium]|jgi:catechol 2,3-dioxygenase-like lactoylglutathione lyase family enzyme|nr:VOC family protein [Desulfobacterales bacterium]